MIEYSKQESDIFGIPFGRLTIEEHFTDWEALKREIDGHECRYIRVKIKNPDGSQLDELKSIVTKVHLLEILRVYRSPDLLSATTEIEDASQDMLFRKTDEKDKEVLGQFIVDTYEDIPFGNYTPTEILEIFPVEKQLLNLKQYFKENYSGTDPEKAAFIAYNPDEKPAGCIIWDYFGNGTPDSGSYAYYIGVARDERNKGMQFKLINFNLLYLKAHHYHYFEASTRLTNLFSARAMEKNGCKCIRYDWVYLLQK